MNRRAVQRLFRVPPFPGAAPREFVRPSEAEQPPSRAEVRRALDLMAAERVGGTYWGARPALPSTPYTLIRLNDEQRLSGCLEDLPRDHPVLIWTEVAHPRNDEEIVVSGTCDPWHMISGARQVVVDGDDELAAIARMANVPVRCVGEGEFSDFGKAVADDDLFEPLFAGWSFADPFTDEEIPIDRVIELSAFWKRLIEGNRNLRFAAGFAFWKQPTVAPLLWGGGQGVSFDNDPEVSAGDTVAVWTSKVPAAAMTRLSTSGARLVEVEDGFIRSAGLGADCVPPLSIVVDESGIYFDPSKPSDLELLLETGDLPPAMIERAVRLRQLIVGSGLSKYGRGAERLERRSDRRHLLVPGQVEDDRSVQCGGGEVKTNLELLCRARASAPDAYILYKPHPDVEAGHRVGAVPDSTVLQFADEIVRDVPISSLIDLVEEVHVNTSLAGFEALLRGKDVTTHGVPFYAGWGLTRDLASVPARRTRLRTLDELVAAVLLVYPRYLDPETGLPCPPEILIRRLSEGRAGQRSGALVTLRRLQGRLRRLFLKVRPR